MLKKISVTALPGWVGQTGGCRRNIVRLMVIFSALALAVSISVPAFAQKKATAGKKTVAQDRSVYGTVSGHVYTNRVIGLKFTLPEFMPISERSFIDIALVSTAPASPNSMYAGRRLTVKLLFSAEGYGPQTDKLMSLTCTAMKLPPSHTNASGADVLDEMNAPMGGPKSRLDTLGGNKISFVDQKTRFASNRTYSFVRRSYSVSCVMIYWEQDDLETMRSILEKGNLDWDGK